MAQAADYPVSFPFGATSHPYTAASPHKGEDRACPTGTPVLVNGVAIGLVGNSGLSFGSHLHIGKFTQNGTLMPPNGQGFHFGTARVLTVSADATNGNYVRLLADGYCYVYLHLSKTLVTVGQTLNATLPTPQQPQGDEMIANHDQAQKLYKMLRPNSNPSSDELNSTAGRRSFAQFINDAQNEVAQRDAHLKRQAELANIGAVASRDSWPDQINGLEAERQRLAATVNELQAAVARVTADDETDKQAISAGLARISELTDKLERQTSQNSATSVSSKAPKSSFLALFLANLLNRKK